MAHDFVRFPELTNSEMEIYYFESPHKQIVEDIRVKCVKVHDGDTITVRWDERNFDFPIRFADINAPELSDEGGKEAGKYLEARLLNEEVDLKIDKKNRVEKWGRLLAKVYFMGMNISDEMVFMGHAVDWTNKDDGKIIDSIRLPKEFA
jgi:endonuclease YncB( thermonuclease family)